MAWGVMNFSLSYIYWLHLVSLTWTLTAGLGSANNSWTQSTCPAWEAQYNGVFPALSSPVPDTPCFRHSRMKFRFPLRAASWRGCSTSSIWLSTGTVTHLCVLYLFVYTTTHCSLKAYCAILVRRSNFRHQVSPCITTREHPAAEGGTVGEKCPVILPKCQFPCYI